MSDDASLGSSASSAWGSGRSRAARAGVDGMLNIIVWLGASYVSAFVVLGAAVAMLSLTTEKTERLLDEEVRR